MHLEISQYFQVFILVSFGLMCKKLRKS